MAGFRKRRREAADKDMAFEPGTLPESGEEVFFKPLTAGEKLFCYRVGASEEGKILIDRFTLLIVAMGLYEPTEKGPTRIFNPEVPAHVTEVGDVLSEHDLTEASTRIMNLSGMNKEALEDAKNDSSETEGMISPSLSLSA